MIFITQTFIKDSFKHLFIVGLLLSSFQLYGATTRNDIKLNEASEDIKLISQQITKEYIYLSLNPQKKETIDNIKDSVLELDEKIRLVASVTKSDDAKDVLSFLIFSRDEISEIVSEEYSIDNALIMLDNSEVLIEGAQSIANEHSYMFSDEEKMLIKVKHMSYLVQRVSKYYMAVQAGFDDEFIKEQLKLSIEMFDKELLELQTYDYDEQGANDLAILEGYWLNTKKLLLTLDKRKLPNIIYISSGYLEDLLENLKLYHSKNQ